ncbi:MAG: glycosyl transferase family 2 [Fibrobacteria bacterium]|nr:glycosyl transferase family 2 [Fibrobacteria bacterium]
MKQLSLVIPAYNEAESIPLLLEEIRAVCEGAGVDYEALVIDDGSTDGTYEVAAAEHARDGRVQAVRFRRNSGKAAALAEGFRRARGRYIITLDADLQDNPAEIPGLIRLLEDGADMVSGWKKIRHDPWHKTVPSKLFNSVTSSVSGLRLNDFNCGLKAYRAEVVKSLDLYGEMHRYIPVLAHWDGFKVAEKVVEHRARRFGSSKYGWARLSNGLFDLVTLVFLHRYTRRPMHLFGFVGLLFALVGFGVLLGFVVDWAVSGQLHVRPLMLAGVLSMFVGVQFASIGLLGEMINQRFARESPPPAIAASTFGAPPTP